MFNLVFAVISALVTTGAIALWITWDMYRHDQAAIVLRKDRKIKFLRAYIKQEATRKENDNE